jgi:hypothetical protein
LLRVCVSHIDMIFESLFITQPFIEMDDTVRRELELLIRTREEDYRELSNKIKPVNSQLNIRMDALIERFEELNKKIVVVTNKVNNIMK